MMVLVASTGINRILKAAAEAEATSVFSPTFRWAVAS